MTEVRVKHPSIVVHARRLLRFFNQNKEKLSPLLILTHDYPDPDALSSAYALNYIAEKIFGVQSRIAYGGIIGRMENRAMASLLNLPVHKLKPHDLKKYANVALVDTQPGFKNNPFPPNRHPTLIIDQHSSVTKPNADLVIVDTECGATSVILAQALLQLKVDIPVTIGTALVYGILTDTMNLYRSPSPFIIDTYLRILHYCDMKTLAQIQNPQRSRRFFATLGKGIQNAMARKNLMVSHLGFVENPDLVAHIADFLLTYKGAKWSICTGRFKNKLHISLRINKTNAEAGEILRDIVNNRKDAGGHDAIAGGSFVVGKNPDEATWAQAESTLIDRLIKRLRIPAKSDFYFPFRRAAAPPQTKTP